MAAPRISVVIPTFNGERFIGDTVRSVLSQTYAAHEIIVVVDGSKDQTSTVLRQFGRRITLLEKSNGGVSSARNAGIDLATGDYIAFLDDDDHWHPDKLQTYASVLQLAGLDQPLFLFSNFRRRDYLSGKEYPLTNTDLNPYLFEYAKPFSPPGSPMENLYRADRESAFALLLRGYPIYPSTIAVARGLLNGNSWPREFKLSEDLLFSLRISQRADFIYVDEVLTTIHRHDKNASIDLMSMLESDAKVLQWIQRRRLFNPERQAKICRALGRKFCGLGWHYRKEHKRGAALGAYLKSVPYPGSRIKAAKGIVAALLPDLSGQANPDVNPPNH